MSIRGWGTILDHLMIFFGGRVPVTLQAYLQDFGLYTNFHALPVIAFCLSLYPPLYLRAAISVLSNVINIQFGKQYNLITVFLTALNGLTKWESKYALLSFGATVS